MRSPVLPTKVILLLAWLALSPAFPSSTTHGQPPERRTASDAMKVASEGAILVSQGTSEAALQAIAKFEEARQIYQQEKYVAREAAMLLAMGEVYNKTLSDNVKARMMLDQATPLIRAAGNKVLEAYFLTITADLQSSEGEKQKAVESFKAAISLYKLLKTEAGEAKTLNNLGAVQLDLGDVYQALNSLRQALEISTRLNDVVDKMLSLTNMGRAYFELGDFQKAVELYHECLDHLRQRPNLEVELTTLNQIALAHKSLGDSKKALEYFSQALSTSRKAGRKLPQMNLLVNIGSIHTDNQRYSEAIKHYEEARSIARELKDKRGESRTLPNLGNVLVFQKKNEEALVLYNQAWELLQQLGDRNGMAMVLDSMGYALSDQGKHGEAEAVLKRSLTLLDQTGNLLQKAKTLRNLAEVQRDSGKLHEAKDNIEAAISLIEALRGQYTNQDFQTRFFASAQDHYGFYIDLLMTLHKQSPRGGFDRTALEVSERARARSLLDLLVEADADVRQGVDPRLLERERSLQKAINAKSMAIISGLSGSDAATVLKEIEELRADYHRVEADIRKTSPKYAHLTQPQPLNLKKVQSQLDRNTLLLEYFLSDERSYGWLVSSVGVKSFELPPRRKVEAVARRLYELFAVKTETSNQELIETGAQLSQILLGPVASLLGRKRLVIVADGALHYIPFGALPEPVALNKRSGNPRPLILLHEVVSIPSISVLAMQRSDLAGRKRAPKEIAVLADPVFDVNDERVRGDLTQSKPIQSQETLLRIPLHRLRGSRTEAEGILDFVDRSSAKVAFGFDANRGLINSGELGQYRYLHFATHGLLETDYPELTAIVLSLVNEQGQPQDGYLRAHEIYNLNLPADVVVLSGCQTGLGQEMKGEGLVGLTRAFMYAEAARIVVSLWSVDDQATSELMIHFYREMIKNRKRPAEALRVAQIEMLKSKDWPASHYWAGFILQGEWR